MPNFVPVNSQLHSKTKVKEDPNFNHAKEQHMVPVVIHEFATACHHYPIAFVKDSETGQFRVVALLGLKPKENLFYDESGWLCEYVPNALLGYPFVLANDKNVADQQILYFDDESPRVNEEDGQSLFDEKGERTKFTDNIGNFLSDLIFRQQQTEKFIDRIVELSLVVPKVLEVKLADEKQFNIDGLYLMDEEALNNLSDKDFLELKVKGYLAPIYSILLSMSQVNSLVQRAQKANS